MIPPVVTAICTGLIIAAITFLAAMVCWGPKWRAASLQRARLQRPRPSQWTQRRINGSLEV